MTTTAFCVTGWHFPPDFYKSLSTLSEVDIYIISHRKRSEIPQFMYGLFEKEKILIRSNIGYDWGCFQQFLKSGIWEKYETVFFMHDDISIKDFGFIEKATSMLKDYAVVGNGVGQGTVSHCAVNKHPYAYAHSSWKPYSFLFNHATVRGSFFATTRDVIRRIESFEVYWDPFKISIEFGNWSTKATCGKIEAALGKNCFGYLSDKFGESVYISEYYRGNESEDIDKSGGLKHFLYLLIKRAAIIYMEILYRQRRMCLNSIWLFILKIVLMPFSKKIY
ncbi:MAG: hypothetical protein MUP11_09260 [Anaerolineales bacterium]|nr:hypothetical protein [Anaerolineales bacterium]